MFFSWTGKGYMVPVAASLSTLGVMGATSALEISITDEAISTTAAIIAGVFLWKFHHYVAQQSSGLVIMDEETGESQPFKFKHDFMFIPLRFWGPVFAAGGILYGLGMAYPGLFGV